MFINIFLPCSWGVGMCNSKLWLSSVFSSQGHDCHVKEVIGTFHQRNQRVIRTFIHVRKQAEYGFSLPFSLSKKLLSLCVCSVQYLIRFRAEPVNLEVEISVLGVCVRAVFAARCRDSPGGHRHLPSPWYYPGWKIYVSGVSDIWLLVTKRITRRYASSSTSVCGDFQSLSTNQNLAYISIDVISDLC